MTAEKLSFHPLVDLFPVMEANERDALRRSIRQFGVLEAVRVWNGQIVDGRNRVEIADEEGIPFETKDVSHLSYQELVDYVMALNGEARRHLKPSQLAAIAIEAGMLTDTLPSEKPSGSRTRDVVAEKMGVSPRLIQQAERVRRDAPERLASVKSGEKTLTEVNRELDAEEKAKGKPPAPPKPALGSQPALADELRHEFKGLLVAITQVKIKAGKLHAGPAGAFFDIQNLELALKNAANEIKFAIPNCICPECLGKGCKQCRNNGWLPDGLASKLPELVA